MKIYGVILKPQVSNNNYNTQSSIAFLGGKSSLAVDTFVTVKKAVKPNQSAGLVERLGVKNTKNLRSYVFDLDDSLAKGTPEEIQKVLDHVKKKKGVLIFSTGNSKAEFLGKQEKWAKEGITIPTPKYLVANDGQYIYENIDGELVKNIDYEEFLRAQTNFESKKVYQIMKKKGASAKYLFTPEQQQRLEKLDNYEAIKASDPESYNSKFTKYEWNPSEFSSKYFVSHEVDIKELQKDIREELAKSGIKTKFVVEQYDKKTMDRCNASILLQSNPIRRHEDGSMTAMFLYAADKATGVKFLQNELKFPYHKMQLAGNGNNDISLAEMSLLGAKFTCLENASAGLKARCNELKTNIFMAKSPGAGGILEGMLGKTKIRSNN